MTKPDNMVSREKVPREEVEDKGKIFEKFDLTPMQGRIIAYFSLCDSPEKTFDELVKYFRTSKSSISSSLNHLLQNKVIDYRIIPNSRKRYFYITDSFLRVYFEKVLVSVREFKENAFRTVSRRSQEHHEVNEKILKWIADADLFQDAIGKTVEATRKD